MSRFDNEVSRVVIAVLLAVATGILVGRPTAPPDVGLVPGRAPDAPVPDEGLATVHVSGAVVSPGLVEVPNESRVADAIAAAGGVTAGADLAGINLADPVVDGRQVVVPSTGVGVTPASGSVATTDGRVRLNTATVEDLQRLPGVGPVLAGKIVEHRDEIGSFSDVEDLLGVSGIGERKLASIRDLVVVP